MSATQHLDECRCQLCLVGRLVVLGFELRAANNCFYVCSEPTVVTFFVLKLVLALLEAGYAWRAELDVKGLNIASGASVFTMSCKPFIMCYADNLSIADMHVLLCWTELAKKNYQEFCSCFPLRSAGC